MQRTFITNLALLLFLNLLIKPFWILGIDRTVQNVVGAGDYGLYYALFNFSYMLNIVLDVGITNFNNRNIAQHSQLVQKHFSSVATLKGGLGLVYLVVTVALGLVIGYEGEALKFLALLCVNQFLLSFVLYLRSNLAGLHLFRHDSVLSVLDRSVMIGLCALLLWGNLTDRQFNIQWFILAQTVSYVVAVITGMAMVIANSGRFRPRFDWAFSIMILKKSLPFAVLVLFMTIYYRIDAVMLERLLPDGKEQAGIYAQAFRLLDATQMLGYLFSVLLLPMFARMIKNKESVEALAGLSSRLLLTGALGLAVVCGFYRMELMDLLYVAHIAQSGPILGILMAAFVPVATTYVFGTLLTANGNLKALNLMAAGGVVLNVVLNALLIPSLEAYGAAVASLITQVLTALVQVALVQYIFRFSVHWKLFASLAVYVAGAIALGFALQQLNLDWKMACGLLVGGIALWGFATRAISVKAIYNIIRYER